MSGSVLVLVLSVVLPAIATDVKISSFADPAVALTALVMLYSAVRLAQLVTRGRDALVQITFWIFVYVWLGLAAMAEVVSGRYSIPLQTFDRSTEVTALTGILIGILAYDVGLRLARRSERPTWLADSFELFEISRVRVWALAGFGTLTTLFFTVTTGLATRFSSRERATATFVGSAAPGQRVDEIAGKSGGLIRIALLWIPAFLALFLLVYLYRSAREGRIARWSGDRPWTRRLANRRLIVVMVGVNILANNPQSNTRARFGGVMIALLLVAFPLRRPAHVRLATCGLLALVLIVFPFAAVFRYDQRVLELAPLKEELITSPDFGMFQQEMNGVIYVKGEGHTFGRQTLGAVFSFVPRSVWPGKPTDTGNLISRTEIINASSTVWTEANVEFGWGGIVVFFVLYGWLSAIFDGAYQRRRDGPSVIGAAVPLFAAFQLLWLRGSVQPVVGELAPVAVVFALCLRRAEPSGPRSFDAI